MILWLDSREFWHSCRDPLPFRVRHCPTSRTRATLSQNQRSCISPPSSTSRTEKRSYLSTQPKHTWRRISDSPYNSGVDFQKELWYHCAVRSPIFPLRSGSLRQSKIATVRVCVIATGRKAIFVSASHFIGPPPTFRSPHRPCITR